MASSSAAWSSDASIASISWKQSASARGTSLLVAKPAWARTREARYFWQNLATSLSVGSGGCSSSSSISRSVGGRKKEGKRAREEKRREKKRDKERGAEKESTGGKARTKERKKKNSSPAPVPVKDPEDALGRSVGDVGEVRVLHRAAPALRVLVFIWLRRSLKKGGESERVRGQG